MSQRNQHLTHAMLRKPATTTPKQFQTTWCFGKDWQHALLLQAGLETFNQQPCPPGILPFRYTCKKLRQFWQKRSLQQSHFRSRRHIGFLDSKKWSPVALKACFQQNPTLIHLRHAKSFVFRAARKVPQCQKWNCHALPLFALERAIPRLFSMSILIAGETKNGRFHGLLIHSSSKAPQSTSAAP